MTVREAKRAELNEVAKLSAKSFGERSPRFPRIKFIFEKVVVALHDGRIVGAVAYSENRNAEGKPFLEASGLTVHSDYRSKGNRFHTCLRIVKTRERKRRPR
ncbi:TPA: GNAT family N-acetyltransferase [Candidatus Micrarchaeota archaeon]|nr:GNAT family N-acetyltransferase [Candidatus Micrarchaeota archaeon]